MEKRLPKIIKNNLLHYMGKQEFNQKQLSELSGVSKQMISVYCKGKATPSPDKIKKLAAALKIQPDQLLEEIQPTQAITPDTAPANVDIVALKISVVQAAKCMGKNEQFIRRGLQTKALDFGSAVKYEKQWSYHISPERFRNYVGPQKFDTFFGIA